MSCLDTQESLALCMDDPFILMTKSYKIVQN